MTKQENDFSFTDLFWPLTNKKVVGILIAVGFIVHYHVLFNGFVWDDLTYIIGNPELKNFNLVTLVGPNMFNSSGYFRPLPAVYFSLLHHLFGNTAFFYHFFQLSLHIVCTSLLYFIFQKFFSRGLSLFLALVFLVHPINVESVAYVGSTQSQLYFIFGCLAFYLSLKNVSSLRQTLLIHGLLLLALLTKEVSFLFLLLIYSYKLLTQKQISRTFIFYTVVTVLIYLTIRFSVLGAVLQKMHLIPISEISLWQRLAHIPIILFYYPKTFFWPQVLAIDQIWTISQLNWSTFYLPLLFDVIFYGGLLALLVYFCKRHRSVVKPYLLFLFWFISGLGLLLQIFPLDMTVADRWFYFPIVGLLGVVGIVIERFKVKNLFLAFFILAALSVRTMIRNADWYSTLTLYGHDVSYYPNYDIENYLGADLVSAGRPKEALVHFKKSVALLPHDTNIFNIGSVYELLKDYPNSKIYYQQALSVKDKYLNHAQVRQLAAEGLSRVTLRLGEYRLSIDSARANLVEFPTNGSLWGYLAIGEYLLNNKPEAIKAAANAKTYLPNTTTEKLYQMIINNQDLTPLLK